MRPIEQIEEAEPFCRVADVAEPPHLKLARATHLQELRPLLLDEFQPQADRVHALLPQLVELTIDRRWRRRDREGQRLAVGEVAPAVAVAVDVAELVEQRLCARRIEAYVAAQLRIVTGDVRRDGLGCGLTLTLA